MSMLLSTKRLHLVMHHLKKLLCDRSVLYTTRAPLKKNLLSNISQVCLGDFQLCIRRNVVHHSSKGWKALANPKLNENDGDFVTNPMSCEDGTDSVPHSVLVSHLNSCSTVVEQIQTLYRKISLNSEDVANRKAFCNAIEDAINPYFEKSKVHMFGSSMNGLGFKGCDVDACVQTVFNQDGKDTGYAKHFEVPQPDDILAGKISPDIVTNLNPKFKLRLIRRILRRHCPEIREPILLIRARCPILRFYHEKYNVFCDLSCVNRFALQNTKLMRFLCHYEDRFGPLAKIARYWGKYGKFVGDIERFNSHSFTLLIVHFLQNVTPPVLPPLAEVINKISYFSDTTADDQDILMESVRSIPQMDNKQSIADLLREFFFFYMYFDFDRVMTPLTGSSVPRQLFQPGEDPSTEVFEMSTITIQDPFRLSFNSTFNAEFKYCKKFLLCIRDVCQMYQKPDIWLPKDTGWGLTAVLESGAADNQQLYNVPEQKTFNIDILVPSEIRQAAGDASVGTKIESVNDVADIVKRVLEYGLLFQCKLSKFPETSNSDKEELLRLQFEVCNNTWIGRYNVMKEQYGNFVCKDPLELEHLISSRLASEQLGRQGQFRLLCEMYHIRENDQSYLRILFKSQTVKFPPALSIFLTDYIPKIMHRLL